MQKKKKTTQTFSIGNNTNIEQNHLKWVNTTKTFYLNIAHEKEVHWILIHHVIGIKKLKNFKSLPMKTSYWAYMHKIVISS